MPILRRAVPLLLALTTAACARGIEVGSPAPSQTYGVSIVNETSVALIVSYNDGRGDAILGNVAAGATERFIIAAPASTSVTIRGASANTSRTAGPVSVTLVAGSTQTVRLR